MLLRHDDHTLLLNLLLVLDLLVVGEKKSALKLAVKLTNFLVDSKQYLLLAHDLDRLKAVRFVLIRNAGEFGTFVRVAIDLPLGIHAPTLTTLVAHHISLRLGSQDLAVQFALIAVLRVEAEGRGLMRVVA